MASIILATLNARYSHASLGLRYLLANMGTLQPQTRLLEFTLQQRPADIVEALLEHDPRVVGFGVYIWNVEETTRVVALLKQVAPHVSVVLGGPEVSHEYEGQRIVQLADYLIPGQADVAFGRLCRRLLDGERPVQKIVVAEPVPLTELVLPYAFYSDHDIAHRLIYVEASRGCPFKCEFCLSSLDKSARPFDLERFLAEMDGLYRRGLRRFKFVDRTFNLNVKSSLRILEFFLERMDERLFLHFEVVPDHLPQALKQAIVRFPPGALQFEIGIQSFDPRVQALISRRQDNRKSEENLAWLRNSSHVHIHADLIAGLPGEDQDGFARSFNRLAALRPHAIQVGILKRLRGAPINRHTAAFNIRYSPHPPYNILCNDRLDFATVQRLSRFARYWDLVGNSGRFSHTLPILLGDDPCAHFFRFSEWLYGTTGQTHRIALERLFDLVYQWLTGERRISADVARAALSADYAGIGAKGRPAFLTLRGREKAHRARTPH